MTALPEVFACPRMTSVKVTRHGCGDRHVRAKNNGRTPGARMNDRAIFAAACRDCAIGAAHARGERPDVTIASLTARPTTTNEEGAMARGVHTVIEHDGETKTLTEWAKAAGMGVETLRKRLAGGESMKDALSRPITRGGRPPHAAPSKAAVQKRAERERKAELKAEEGPVSSDTATGSDLDRIAKRLACPRRDGETDAKLRERIHSRVVGSGEHAFEVLHSLGFDVEDAGPVPAGRLLLVRVAA